MARSKAAALIERLRRPRRQGAGGAEAELPRWMQPIEVPAVPAGWRTGPPDFVGVGAQRAGSSWWYRFAIEAHPRVVRAPGQRKELHYFDRFWQGGAPSDCADSYHRLFPRPEGALTGEWTPRYMHDFWTPPLLREAAPDARILVMLRDPVERYLSGLARELRLARRRSSPITLAHVADAVHRGAYFESLRALLDLYPREQVLVLQYERCADEPVAELERTCRFLGLEPPAEPEPELLERRRPPSSKPQLDDQMRAALVARLRDDVARVAGLCPEIDPGLWPNFAGVVAGAGEAGGPAAEVRGR